MGTKASLVATLTASVLFVAIRFLLSGSVDLVAGLKYFVVFGILFHLLMTQVVGRMVKRESESSEGDGSETN